MTEKLKTKCKLRSLMLERGVSQLQMAKNTGISTDTIRALQRNSSVLVHLPTVDRICDYLGCEIGELLVRELD